MLQLGVVVFLVAAALYAAPSIVAAVKGHRRWPLIVVLNILLGWTIVGWLLALAIALEVTLRRSGWTKRRRTSRPKPVVVRPQPKAVLARRDANDPPEIREDVYAAWLDEGAGIHGQS